MEKPDVIITWPSGLDYPLCRWQLREYRSFFKDVFLTFYEHGDPSYEEFIAKSHPEFKCLFSPIFNEQWREAAVCVGLRNSKSDEILFTEQDFFWKSEDFLNRVKEARGKYDIVGIKQGNRLHPCFLQTSRELIDHTSCDFSVKGQDKDHFQKFSEEALQIGTFIDLKELGLFEGRDWYHFSSLTWNLLRIKDEDITEMHELPEFLIYNQYSRTPRVPQSERWMAFTYYAEHLLTKFGRFLDPAF
ncbi:MAG: hypothetical protein EHM20_01340 [Alphaproteobacteria bacterium]|nr:MAG: hypothetical protein EHM20_01340 [Alphaproteobacteria bacterium]